MLTDDISGKSMLLRQMLGNLSEVKRQRILAFPVHIFELSYGADLLNSNAL